MNLSDRLIARANKAGADSVGVGKQIIQKIPLTNDFVDEIIACLSDEDMMEVKWGMWFGSALLETHPPDRLVERLIACVRDWMECGVHGVSGIAIEILVCFRNRFPDYRELMFKALKNADPETRSYALGAFQTFLTIQDIPHLMGLEKDPYAMETSMGSPLVCAIRNQAFEVIEALAGKKFQRAETAGMIE